MVGCVLVVHGREIRIFKLTTDSNDSIPSLSWDEIESLSKTSLFADKSWKWSNQSWSLPADAIDFLDKLGNAGVSFFRALERLYLKSAKGERIFRNKDLKTPWVAEYFDAGKPQWLVNHSRSSAMLGVLPLVLRPDLLPTRDGFALTEWDSVPGGIGLTDHLGRLYLRDDAPKMAKAFGQSLLEQAGELGDDAQFAILVSEESDTYRPEMEWLAEELRRDGLKIDVAAPDEISFSNDCAYLKDKKIDIVYRFWELFDTQIANMSEFANCVESGNLVVTPGMRPFLEEKLSLALLHHPRLQDYWQENLSKEDNELLSKTIPPSWILDPAPVPPGASIDGPLVRGDRLQSWKELSEASKKERSLIIKASGFHETAWGARSVVVGEDVSSDDWTQAVEHALTNFPNPVSILQEFKKPVTMNHPVYNVDARIEPMKGRLRLSPYYFLYGGEAKLSGALATFCPADKKVIHGMKDGALLPCSMT
jgi:hypothetical protein